MSEPDARHSTSYGPTLERSADEILQAARPLPWDDEMIIEDLTEEEEALFVNAIRDA